MDPKNTLDSINSENKVNAVISRDEESVAGDTSLALQMAEDLILQLPKDLEGRNRWLARFGNSPEARTLRKKDAK